MNVTLLGKNHPLASYILATDFFLSDKNGNGILYLSRKVFNLSGVSKLTPIIFTFAFSYVSNWSRNPHASFLHPGVSAMGKK
jgi:hypothetical protein